MSIYPRHLWKRYHAFQKAYIFGEQMGYSKEMLRSLEKTYGFKMGNRQVKLDRYIEMRIEIKGVEALFIMQAIHDKVMADKKSSKKSYRHLIDSLIEKWEKYVIPHISYNMQVNVNGWMKIIQNRMDLL